MSDQFGTGSHAEINGPCAACGAMEKLAGRVWGFALCQRCVDDWGHHSPVYGDIEAKYGTNADSAAIYRAFTERWIAARKARAA